LCALCEGGQILAADVVRLMAGRRSRHECRSLGKLTLKGCRMRLRLSRSCGIRCPDPIPAQRSPCPHHLPPTLGGACGTR
jgi:class 3 adenylate cyclase